MYIVTRNVLHFQKMFVSLLYVLTELVVKARQLDPACNSVGRGAACTGIAGPQIRFLSEVLYCIVAFVAIAPAVLVKSNNYSLGHLCPGRVYVSARIFGGCQISDRR